MQAWLSDHSAAIEALSGLITILVACYQVYLNIKQVALNKEQLLLSKAQMVITESERNKLPAVKLSFPKPDRYFAGKSNETISGTIDNEGGRLAAEVRLRLYICDPSGLITVKGQAGDFVKELHGANTLSGMHTWPDENDLEQDRWVFSSSLGTIGANQSQAISLHITDLEKTTEVMQVGWALNWDGGKSPTGDVPKIEELRFNRQ